MDKAETVEERLSFYVDFTEVPMTEIGEGFECKVYSEELDDYIELRGFECRPTTETTKAILLFVPGYGDYCKRSGYYF